MLTRNMNINAINNKLLAALISVASATSLSANANTDFNYVSAGYQLSVFDTFLPTDSSDRSDHMSGYYLRGSWNFYNHFFAELRSDTTSRNNLSLNQNLIGLGYYHPFTDNFALYGLIGVEQIDVQFDIKELLSKFDVSTNGQTPYVGIKDSATTGEIGAKINMFNTWEIEPAIRIAGYDEMMYELRLGNTVSITDNIKIEANFVHRALEMPAINENIREMNYQLGMRYSF